MPRLGANEGHAHDVGQRDRPRTVPAHERTLLSGLSVPPWRDTDVCLHRLEPELCEVRCEENTEVLASSEGVEAPDAIALPTPVASLHLGGDCSDTLLQRSSGHGSALPLRGVELRSTLPAPWPLPQGHRPSGPRSVPVRRPPPDPRGNGRFHEDGRERRLRPTRLCLDALVEPAGSLPLGQTQANEELAFSFDYPTFCLEFRAALTELEMSHLGVLPYAWRHSGPSIHRAQNRRALLEVQKRGRWKQAKSVARYEKAGT